MKLGFPFLSASLFAACAIVAPRVSWGSEGTAATESEPRAVDVEAAVLVGTLARKGEGTMVAPLQLAAGYRANRSVSYGVVGSYTFLDAYSVGSSVMLSMWRAAAEARWHPVSGRVADTWLGGELGVGMVSEHYANNGVEGGAVENYTNRRFAPLLGLGAGASLFPVPYVSLGIEARAHLIPFGSTQFTGAPQGLTPAAYAGLVLGLHVPFGG